MYAWVRYVVKTWRNNVSFDSLFIHCENIVKIFNFSEPQFSIQ